MEIILDFREENGVGSSMTSPLQVGEDTVEIRNYGIQSPIGYKVGLIINGVEITQILTGSKEFMELVGREAVWKKKNIFSKQYQLQSFSPIDENEFLRELSIWATTEYTKFKSK